MNRSCEFCMYRYEQESFEGTMQRCSEDDKEIKLDSYCEDFKEKK